MVMRVLAATPVNMHEEARRRRASKRDCLLIMLTCYAGLRIQEACSLHRRDFTDVNGMITDTLFVFGRGVK